MQIREAAKTSNILHEACHTCGNKAMCGILDLQISNDYNLILQIQLVVFDKDVELDRNLTFERFR